jgi:sporadic carbohydrate cluster 2OG-Fe(II) oxygenase
MSTRNFIVDNLYNSGFSIFSLTDKDRFDRLCKDVRDTFIQFGVEDNVDRMNHNLFFKSLHIFSPFDELDINQSRLQVISALSDKRLMINSRIFDLVKDEITQMLGPDLLIQRSVNIVIQRPRDTDTSEPHRDYPANSAFELVIWLPLCDCPAERSMYMVDFKSSLGISRMLNEDSFVNLDAFRAEVLRRSSTISVRYGECLLFMTPLFHGSLVNSSDGTRVSFNMRVKSFFSPSGSKDPFTFWEPLNISPVTKRAFEAINNEL